MFRGVLENQNQQLTSLKNEMDFIDSYLAIQKLRFENKISLQLDIAENCMEAELPFMLLHTLVENAVQHGSQLESDENIMLLKVSSVDNRLNINLLNKASKSDDHKGFGIGVSNTRDRLEKLYKVYRLDLCAKRGGFFETTLAIPISVANV